MNARFEQFGGFKEYAREVEASEGKLGMSVREFNVQLQIGSGAFAVVKRATHRHWTK